MINDMDVINRFFYNAVLDNNIEVVKVYINRGADLEFIPGRSLSETSNFILTPLQKAISLNLPDLAQVLIKAGADIHNRGNSKRCLIEFAYLAKGMQTVLALLVEMGSEIPEDYIDKVNRRLNPSRNPDDVHHRLYYAVSSNNLQSFRECLAGGGNLEFIPPLNKQGVNNLNKTPLQVATQSGYAEMAIELINAGADFNSLGKTSKSPLDYCLYNDAMSSVVELLLDKGAVKTPSAVQYLDTFLAKNLPHRLSEDDLAKANMRIEKNNENAMLQRVIDAIKSGAADENFWIEIKTVAHKTVMNLNLLQYFCKSFKVETDFVRSGYYKVNPHNNNITLLDESDCLDVITSLVESGVDINAADDKGWTPLLFASRNVHFSNISAIPPHLVGLGANPEAQSVMGKKADDKVLFTESFEYYASVYLELGIDATDPHSEHMLEQVNHSTTTKMKI